MAIGSNIGNTYLFRDSPEPQRLPQSTSQYPQENIPDMMGDPQSELQAVDETTEAYLNGFANLKGMQRTLYKDYGIDVTAPDFSNPEETKVYQSFMKQYAKVQSLGNSLKVGRENQKRKQLLSQNADFVDRGTEGLSGTQGDDFTTTAVREYVKEQERGINQKFETNDALEEAITKRDILAQSLEEQGRPEEASLVKSWTPSKDVPTQRAPRQETVYDRNNRDLGQLIPSLYQSDVDGEERVSEQIKALGLKDYTSTLRGFNDKGEPVRYIFKSKGDPIEINLTNPDQGVFELGTAIQAVPKYRSSSLEFVDPSTISMEGINQPDESGILKWEREAQDFQNAVTNFTRIGALEGSFFPTTSPRGTKVKEVNDLLSKAKDLKMVQEGDTSVSSITNLEMNTDQTAIGEDEFRLIYKQTEPGYESENKTINLNTAEGKSFINSLFKYNPTLVKSFNKLEEVAEEFDMPYKNNVPAPTTQEQYDELPSGTKIWNNASEQYVIKK